MSKSKLREVSAPGSTWVKCMSANGSIRGVSVDAKAVVQTISSQHGYGGTSVKAVAETIVGTLLLASYGKTGDRVNLNIQGNGWMTQALADADADGNIRAYVYERKGEWRTDGADRRGVWGDGVLSVLRSKVEAPEPYIGTVELLTGHLAKDLTFYWAQSEQVPTAMGIQIGVNRKGEVEYADGFLIQALPTATDEDLAWVEDQLARVQTFDPRSLERRNRLGVLSSVMPEANFMVLEEKELHFKCRCSAERVERTFYLLGLEEVASILKEDGKATVTCDFCSKAYNVSKEQLEEIQKKLSN